MNEIKMKKYAIKLYQSEVAADLIFHATPSLTNYEWQWYVTDDKNNMGRAIEGQRYESFITTTDLIKERGYEGLYLYCEYKDKSTKKECKTKLIRLYSDINNIINSGTIFDDISAYDEEGMIVIDTK